MLPGGVRALVWGPDDTLWIGTVPAALWHRGRTGASPAAAAGDIPSAAVHALLASPERCCGWAAGKGLTLIHDGRARTYTTADGLGDNLRPVALRGR